MKLDPRSPQHPRPSPAVASSPEASPVGAAPSIRDGNFEVYLPSSARLPNLSAEARAAFPTAEVWTERTALLKSIASQLGRCIPREEMPATFSVLSERFDALAKEQRGKVKGFGDCELFILDSNRVNAFMVGVSEPGVSSLRTLAFVTTGFLENALAEIRLAAHEPTPERLAEVVTQGMLRATGALSHELAHGIHRSETGTAIRCEDQNQQEELRCDLEGTDMLRRAGLPGQAMLETLQGLATTPTGGRRGASAMVGALTSSHPDLEVRTAAVRGLLTVQRYE